MLTKVTEGLSTIIDWVATLISALFGTATEAGGVAGSLEQLATLVAIGIAASALFLGVKVIKSLVWGM